MRLRSRFVFKFQDWNKVIAVVREHSELLKERIYSGNYCYWTEDEETKNLFSKFLNDAGLLFDVDMEYTVAEDKDLEQFKSGDKVRFKGETVIAGETDWIYGTVFDVTKNKRELKTAPFGEYMSYTPSSIVIDVKKGRKIVRYRLAPVNIRAIEKIADNPADMELGFYSIAEFHRYLFDGQEIEDDIELQRMCVDFRVDFNDILKLSKYNSGVKVKKVGATSYTIGSFRLQDNDVIINTNEESIFEFSLLKKEQWAESFYHEFAHLLEEHHFSLEKTKEEALDYTRRLNKIGRFYSRSTEKQFLRKYYRIPTENLALVNEIGAMISIGKSYGEIRNMFKWLTDKRFAEFYERAMGWRHNPKENPDGWLELINYNPFTGDLVISLRGVLYKWEGVSSQYVEEMRSRIIHRHNNYLILQDLRKKYGEGIKIKREYVVTNPEKPSILADKNKEVSKVKTFKGGLKHEGGYIQYRWAMNYRKVIPERPNEEEIEALITAYNKVKSPVINYATYRAISEESGITVLKLVRILKYIHKINPHSMSFNVDTWGNNVFVKFYYTVTELKDILRSSNV